MLGRKLAQRIRERNWDIDCIVPVPDGSRPSAIELSAALELPYRCESVHLFSKLNKMFFGYFDPENILFDNENK